MIKKQPNNFWLNISTNRNFTQNVTIYIHLCSVGDQVYISRTVSDDQLSYSQDRIKIGDHWPAKHSSHSNWNHGHKSSTR